MNVRYVAVLGLVGLVACSGAAQDEAPIQEGRVTTSIHAAILGQAPPPSGEHVRYISGDEGTIGYLAVPDGEGPFPAVILIHEWNGLVDRIRQVADAFSREGYVAFAADLHQGRTGSNREENMALVTEARENMDRVIANLNAAQQFLRERPDVAGKVGVLGWCFGGGIALSYGLGGEHHNATAIFYGSLVEDPEVLRSMDHPVYGTFAANDRGIPPEQVERFASALDEIGIDNDIHIYDHVNHGFWLYVDADPETNEEPARNAWQRLKSFLERTLGE
jgi:carboxymethylenebutenolidase